MPVHPQFFQIPQEPMSPAPKKHHLEFPKPLLRFQIHDLSHPGTHAFLSAFGDSLPTVLHDAVKSVLTLLYTSKKHTSDSAQSQSSRPHSSEPHIPSTRSVTLILQSMEGVAYTTGLDLDDDHKEIHFSIDYIQGIPEARRKREILGVLVHEMVHCWQHNAFGTAPGGLVEGIADWVRLNADLAPPHWKQEADGDWDAGYQHTGYFLEYLEQRFGKGSVMAVNQELRRKKYDEAAFWQKLFDHDVATLWKQYGKSLAKKAAGNPTEESEQTESCGDHNSGEVVEKNEDHRKNDERRQHPRDFAQEMKDLYMT
ncbi:hypothetical protein LTR04_002215 [Oleoguttula sp. CCFEE 6159]|nr:hypothetical protein LTR04_002215 [Oleoguttula sp. CCFEE 6159]